METKKNKTGLKALAVALGLLIGVGVGYTLFTQKDDTTADTSTSSSIEPTSTQSESTSAETGEISFIDGALASELISVDCTLSDGTATTCDQVHIAGAPANAEIGPFCPATTTTLAEEAGIWVDGDNLYDVDGSFITSLAEIYDDPNWKLYNDDGTVRVTDTKEAFEAAARPDVAAEYNNYCVEGQIAWLDGGVPIESTFLIPQSPISTGSSTNVAGKVGVTLNGVVIDPSAPVSAILGAYTIAAFDDCGGHVNPTTGYHIHAATDCSEVGESADGETRAFAFAMDGFMIHSPYAEGEAPSDLDSCNGHTTDSLGYHYHANPPEDNAVLSCFMGAVEESQVSQGGGPGGAGGPPRQR